MSALLAILRFPAICALFLALLVCSGCGQVTSRHAATDNASVTTQDDVAQPADVVAEPLVTSPAEEQPTSEPQPLLFADERPEPYQPRGPPGLTFLPFFPAPLLLPADLVMPNELGVVVESVVQGNVVVAWAAVSPVGWRVGWLAGPQAVGFRYYNPVTGRYISADPLGFAAGTMNFYAYVGNNPINKIDPLGLIELGELESQHAALAEQASAIRETIAGGGDASGAYKQYLAGYNQLNRSSGEFLNEQWWTSEADMEAASLVNSLPMTFQGIKASLGELKSVRESNEEYGTAIDSTLTKLDRTETAVEVVVVAGTVAGALTGVGAVATVAKEAAKFGLKEGLSYVAKESVKQVVKDTLGMTHKNSLKSRAVTQGYHLVDRKTGALKKIGETTGGATRYSKGFLKKNNVDMKFVNRGTKAKMRQWERESIQEHARQHGQRPPLNKVDH